MQQNGVTSDILLVKVMGVLIKSGCQYTLYKFGNLLNTYDCSYCIFSDYQLYQFELNKVKMAIHYIGIIDYHSVSDKESKVSKNRCDIVKLWLYTCI